MHPEPWIALLPLVIVVFPHLRSGFGAGERSVIEGFNDSV